MKKTFCFGELLIRFSPAGDWTATQQMPVYIGGAELNVARALNRWNLPVAYCTALPPGGLSPQILARLDEEGIDTSAIRMSGDRVGLYFVTPGADMQSSAVTYDRRHSSFGSLGPGQFDWDVLLANAAWLHLSAISPALGAPVAALCREAVEAAAARGIPVSIDLNHREKLWASSGQDPVATMEPLVAQASVISGNIWAAASLLAIPLDASIHEKGVRDAYLEHADRTASAIRQKFPSCKTVANTFRFTAPSGTVRYFAALHHEGVNAYSRDRVADTVVDRVGSGDCFVAGIIYGLQFRLEPQETVEFASAAAFMKMQETGDATRHAVPDIIRMANAHA